MILIIVANEEGRDSSIAAKANVEIMYTKLNLNMNSRILGHIDHYSLSIIEELVCLLNYFCERSDNMLV